MTLEDFIAEERARLIAFERFWTAMMQDRPDEFPHEQEPGDWDEQFFTFAPDAETTP